MTTDHQMQPEAREEAVRLNQEDGMPEPCNGGDRVEMWDPTVSRWCGGYEIWCVRDNKFGLHHYNSPQGGFNAPDPGCCLEYVPFHHVRTDRRYDED